MQGRELIRLMITLTLGMIMVIGLPVVYKISDLYCEEPIDLYND